MKSRLTYICIFTLMIFVFSNCTTTSQMYLQSAKYTNDTTYGYSILNPIILKYSKSFGYKNIIEEYISRLYISPITGRGPGSFTIIEKETISLQQGNTKNDDIDYSSIKRSKLVDSLERVKIISDSEIKLLNVSKKQTYTLYFELAKHKKKLYFPSGFTFSLLVD